MAGSISLSLSQQFDAQGKPLSGGKLYFFQAGTSTPQNAFKDVALTLAHPNPITLDASGRIPSFYLADGQIKIRLDTQASLTVIAEDNLLVIGPSSGAGSPPSVDATKLLDVGDVKCKYGTGVLTGFVRLNGRTIGSATSGASERANADAQALFEYLWTADANLAVSGGRGASANADWLSNKTITLPDFRGRVPGGLDGMGNSVSGRLDFVFGASDTLGNAAGQARNTIITGNLPAYTPSGSVSVGASDSGHFHFEVADVSIGSGLGGLNSGNQIARASGAGGDGASELSGTGTAATIGKSSTATSGINYSPSFNGAPQGGTSTPFTTTQPTILVTYYIKL